MQAMTTWDDFRVFLAVHRGASHAAAARLLRVDATTVSRRMAAIEAALGARLFTRTPGGLAPTAAALALLPHAERVEAELLAAQREIAGTDERIEGNVRITAPDGTATYVLVPGLAALRAKHPSLRPELVVDNKALDLVRREADIAVRFFRPRETSLVARRIGTIRYGLYGGESYLARQGRPRTLRDLANHDWVRYPELVDPIGHLAPAGTARAWARRAASRGRIVLVINNTPAIIAACAAGHGLAALGTMIAQSEPRLVRVLPRHVVGEGPIWAVTHPDLRRNARVVAVLRWLEALFAEANVQVG